MKRTAFVSLFMILILPAQATHLMGGQITWECTTNGQYQFYMELYRNCSTPGGGPAAGWPFNQRSISIGGTTLPRGANNVTINSIQMSPDSVMWLANGLGSTAPDCAPNTQTLSCLSGYYGTYQRFFYKSDPITLRGVPPVTGWQFYLLAPCCRPSYTNITTGGSGSSNGMVLRSFMYPDAQNSNAQNCYNASPKFAEVAQNLVCRQYPYSFNHGAIDIDGDSLSYSLTAPTYFSGSFVQVAYNVSYSSQIPLPDQSLDSNNVPLSIDNSTGQIDFTTFTNSGSSFSNGYILAIQVDEWRAGQKIATVIKEYPYVLYDCDTNYTTVPSIKIGNGTQSLNYLEVFEGDVISLPVRATDFGMQSGQSEEVKLTVNGLSVSSNTRDSLLCDDPRFTSCAFFTNDTFKTNTRNNYHKYELLGLSQVNTRLNWRPYLVNSSKAQVAHINFMAQDMTCPIPKYAAQTLSIKIKPRVTSLNVQSNPSEFNIYPNPSNGEINIRTEEDINSVELRSMDGRMIHSKWNSQDHTLQLPKEKGIYFIRIETTLGNYISRKVVKI